MIKHKGYASVVQRLLEENVEIDREDRDGNTALSWAARRGHLIIVRALLNKARIIFGIVFTKKIST